MSIAYFKFDNYKLPHNPKNINIYMERNNDSDCVIISTSGELYGENCNLYINELERIFKTKKKGILYIPESGVFDAELLKFDYNFTSVPNLATYSFTFRQITQQNVDENTYYTAKDSDTLWSISKKLNCSVDTLVKLNEGKINSYIITDGDKIIVPLVKEVAVP